MRQEDVPVLNDQAYLTAIYERHAPALLAYLKRHARAPEDTEDLLLEVFLAALERPGFAQLSEDMQQAWLWRVAHNKAVDYLRKQVHRRGVSLEHVTEEQYEQDLATPETVMLRGEAYQRLQVHIQRLPAIQQEIVRLRFANGLKSAEIATVLQISIRSQAVQHPNRRWSASGSWQPIKSSCRSQWARVAMSLWLFSQVTTI